MSTWYRIEITAPHISSPTMNCSPSMARMRFSQQRDASPFFSLTIHFPPLLLAESCKQQLTTIQTCKISNRKNTHYMVYHKDEWVATKFN